MNSRMDKRILIRMDKRMDKWMNSRMDKRMLIRMDIRMDKTNRTNIKNR